MRFVQIGSKVKGRFKKNEQYTVEEFLELIAPRWLNSKKAMKQRIEKAIRKDN